MDVVYLDCACAWCVPGQVLGAVVQIGGRFHTVPAAALASRAHHDLEGTIVLRSLRVKEESWLAFP